MSVWVMTSPLTMAVALTTDGKAEPNTCGFSGRLSVAVDLVCDQPCDHSCALAVADENDTAALVLVAHVIVPRIEDIIVAAHTRHGTVTDRWRGERGRANKKGRAGRRRPRAKPLAWPGATGERTGGKRRQSARIVP